MDDFRLKQNPSIPFGQNKPKQEGLNVPGLNVPQKLGQAIVEEQNFQQNLKSQEAQKLNRRYEVKRVTKPSFGEVMNNENKDYPSIQRVRTFKDDIAQAVETNQLSTVKIAIAEQQKRKSLGLEDENSFVKKQKKPWGVMGWIVFIIILFSILLGGAILFVYVQNINNQKNQVVPEENTFQHFLYSDAISEIQVSDEDDKASFVKKINDDKEKLEQGKIKLYEIKKGQSLISTDQLFSLLQTGTPPELTRSLDSVFEFGNFYSDRPIKFLVLKTNSYDLSYAGMLGWEKYLGQDLNDVLYSDKSLNIASSSTAADKVPEFQDGLMYNKDIRSLNNLEGNLIFFYCFIDSKTLVITSDETALKEIIDRLTIKRIKR